MPKPKDLSESQWQWLRYLVHDGKPEGGDAGFYTPMRMQGRTLRALLDWGYLKRADHPSYPPRASKYRGRPEYHVTDRGRAAVGPV